MRSRQQRELPVVSDVVMDRPLRGEATIGGLVAVAALVALVRRLMLHLRAWSLRRRLLR